MSKKIGNIAKACFHLDPNEQNLKRLILYCIVSTPGVNQQSQLFITHVLLSLNPFYHSTEVLALFKSVGIGQVLLELHIQVLLGPCALRTCNHRPLSCF